MWQDAGVWEKACALNCAVLDKTGTITKGHPEARTGRDVWQGRFPADRGSTLYLEDSFFGWKIRGRGDSKD